MTMTRGSQRAIAQAATGPSMAPATQTTVMAEAVAAREPPNSSSSGGKKTGNVLVIPATRNAQAKASASRPLTRLSRLAVILRVWPIRDHTRAPAG
jgi:hypothetical protein